VQSFIPDSRLEMLQTLLSDLYDFNVDREGINFSTTTSQAIATKGFFQSHQKYFNEN